METVTRLESGSFTIEFDGSGSYHIFLLILTYAVYNISSALLMKNQQKLYVLTIQTGALKGGRNNIKARSICLIILLLAILSQAEGKTGYDIFVTVNNSTASTSFSRSHYTSVFDFNSESHYKGDGNSSKYIKIDGLGGVGLKENTYTKEGRLKEDNRLSAGSSVNFVSIDEDVSNNAEEYNVNINESMPSFLLSVDETVYRGEGIYKRNSFINNEDEIMTSYHAKKFSESSAFLARYRNALIIADVTPAGIVEFVGENYSTTLQLASESDLYSGFKFRSPDEHIEEDYVGSFKISKKLSKEHSFRYDNDDQESMLDCCPSAYPGLDYSLRAAWLCLCRSALTDSNRVIK